MKMAPDESKLKPFFRGPQNLVNNVGANSQEVRKFEKNPIDISFQFQWHALNDLFIGSTKEKIQKRDWIFFTMSL